MTDFTPEQTVALALLPERSTEEVKVNEAAHAAYLSSLASTEPTLMAPRTQPKKVSKVDKSYMGGLYHYAITLTKPQGFSPTDETWILEAHRRYERYNLVRELCENGNVHYHSGIACKSPASAGAISKQWQRIYTSHNLAWIPTITVKVKKMSDFWGWMLYLEKEVKGDRVALHGWQLTFLQEGLVENIMRKPTRVIMKNRRSVKKHEAVDLILDFSNAIALPITGKESYKSVIKKMTRKGYRFHNVRHEHVFQEVMCVNGDDSYLDRGLENALQFL